MRFNRVRLDEPPRPRARTPYPPAFQPAPPAPPNIPIPPAPLKRELREDEPLEGARGARRFPDALQAPPPPPPPAIPIPPPRLKRTLRFDDPLEGHRGARLFPAGLYNRNPPQFLTGTTGLGIDVTFDNGSLGVQLTGQYSLAINLSFGDGALVTAPFTLFIDGVDQTALLLANSLEINMQISQVTTARFSLYDSTGNPANIPEVGQQVVLYRQNIRVFGGYVEKPVQSQYMASTASVFAGGTANGSGGAVQCSDYSSMLDRRYVGKYYDSFSGGSLNIIVQDIVTTYLAADGFAYDSSNGDPGITIDTQLFDWVTVRQAFSTLSSITGWDFTVDAFQVIRFYPHGSGTGNAPFNIADNDGNTLAESMTLAFDRSTYRNRQGVRSASQATALWSDIYSTAQPGPLPSSPQPPDGVRKFFVTLYHLSATPVVTVNGVPKIVKSLLDLAGNISQPGYDFYWDPPQSGFPGGNFVEQTPLEAPLSSADVLVVSYQTQLSPIVWAQDNAQINARAAIEGNTGVYEDVQNAPTTMTDPAAQLQYAQALLARYGSQGIPYTVSYTTDTDGLFPGMRQSVQQTTPSVSLANGLISQVTMKDVDKTFFRYTVAVESGEYLAKGAAEFFAAILSQLQQPQAANRNTYTWQIAPSYPGVTNPGITGGYVTPMKLSSKNGRELVLYMQVALAAPIAGATAHFALLQNTNGVLAIDILVGQSGVQTVFAPSSVQFTLNDLLQIEVDGTFTAIKDATVTVVTAVLVN